MDRHRRAEDRQPLAQRDHLLLVQPEQGALHQLGHVANAAAAQQGVAVQRGEQIAHRGFDLDVLAAAALGHLAHKMRQQQLGGLPAQDCRLFQHLPGPLQRHHQRVARDLAQPQVARAAVLVAPVARHAAQQPLHDVGANCRHAPVAQRLAGVGQDAGECPPHLGIGRGFAHQGDQLGFELCG